MKMRIIVDHQGKVVGSARVEEKREETLPFGGRMVPSAEQTVHEVEVPDDVLEAKSAAELHRALANFVPRKVSSRMPPISSSRSAKRRRQAK